MVALLPILAIVIGALVYGLSANPKVAELGRLVFGAAVLVVLWSLAGRTVHLF